PEPGRARRGAGGAAGPAGAGARRPAMSPAPHHRLVTRGRTPAPGAGNLPYGGSRITYYRRLARVSLRHGYYRASGGACPDLAVRPTAWTAARMRTLGLLFRAEEAGFSVLYDELRERQLLDFLRREQGPRGAWTRLCFTLSLRNPWFVNFTALP